MVILIVRKQLDTVIIPLSIYCLSTCLLVNVITQGGFQYAVKPGDLIMYIKYITC